MATLSNGSSSGFSSTAAAATAAAAAGTTGEGNHTCSSVLTSLHPPPEQKAGSVEELPGETPSPGPPTRPPFKGESSVAEEEEENEEEKATLQQIKASLGGGISSEANQSMETCFSSFDRDGDGFLNYAEFVVLCRALFRNERDKPYHVEPKRLRDMFDTFDINKDGLIDINEFELCWQKWIRKIVRPVCSLVVVDVQNDFISGSLSISNCPAKHNGEEVVEPINTLLDTVEFDCVCYTLDWHPENHLSFLDNISLRKLHASSAVSRAEEAKLFDTVVFEGPPMREQKLWPRHCVQNSWGAKIHENVKIVEGSPFIYKGTNPEMDSYSAFFDNQKLQKTQLDRELRNRGVTDVFVCGLAYDVCVGYTALHSIELGYRTMLVEDASRGITIEDMVMMKKKVEDGHGIVVQSDQIKPMVQGRDRRPELGYKLAMELRKQIKQLEQENRI